MKEDRLVAGSVAGTIAILIQTVYALTIKSLGLTDRIYIDFAKVIIISENRPGIGAFFIGLIAQLVIGGMFDVIFAFIEGLPPAGITSSKVSFSELSSGSC